MWLAITSNFQERKQFMQRFVIAILALLSLATFASAQVPTSGNVFFGYSYQSAESSGFDLAGLGRSNMNGWNASLEGKMFPFLGIVADFGSHYGSESVTVATTGGAFTDSLSGHQFTVMFGPRVGVPIGKFRPFAEALFGVGHMHTDADSDTSFATALGGGIDYKIIKPIALRFEGDYVHTSFFGGGQNNVRLSTGIVVRF
jgi:opacity protein-like surface antigen